jgi:hypothetical protein
MEGFRRLVQRGLRGVDRRYHRLHRLQSVGPILYVGRDRYSGPTIQFADDTLLEVGDDVGTLHFNNARFTQLEAQSPSGAALGFVRLMIESLRALADKSQTDPGFSDLAVYYAVSWLPGHGDKIGFVTAPYPDGIRRRLMATHFRILIWAFAPMEQSRGARPDPHYYWMTRKELLTRFGGKNERRGRRIEQAASQARARHG